MSYMNDVTSSGNQWESPEMSDVPGNPTCFENVESLVKKWDSSEMWVFYETLRLLEMTCDVKALILLAWRFFESRLFQRCDRDRPDNFKGSSCKPKRRDDEGGQSDELHRSERGFEAMT
jgi:hypothetical protein